MLINIVGGDGSGKTTQVERLRGWVEEVAGRPVRVLTKGSTFNVSDFAAARMFGMEYEAVADEIVPLLPDESRSLFQIFLMALAVRRHPPGGGEIVLTDGYWHKSYATEAALGIDAAWLLRTCSFFPIPDVSILLDVEPWVVAGRGLVLKPYECGMAPECDERSFVRYQERVLSLLRSVAASEGWYVVDAAAPADEVTEVLRGILHGYVTSTAASAEDCVLAR